MPERFEILNNIDAPLCVVEKGEVYRNRRADVLFADLPDSRLIDLLDDSRALENQGMQASESEFDGARVFTLSPVGSSSDYAGLSEKIKNICLVCAYSEGTMDGVYYAVSETARLLEADCTALFVADEEAGVWRSVCLCTADGDNDGFEVRTDIPLEEFVPVERLLDKKSSTVITGLPEASLISGGNSGVCVSRVSDGDDTRAILWIERRNAPENWTKRESSFIYMLLGVLKMALRRSRMESELKQALHNAEEASKAKTEFLSSVSHEIRTPINAVLGMTRLAIESNDMAEIHNSMKNVEAAGSYLLGIINDILDISRVEAGRMSISPEHYILREMISSVRDMISFAAGAKGLRFSCRCDGDLPECLYGDSQRVSQVLINLLNNAVKFTERGEVRLHVSRHDGMLCFDVSDTGIGIKKEDYDKLFVAFERLNETVVRRSEGTGLGLRITKSIVELMGGSISVESTYQKGSTFTVLLPLQEGDRSAVKAAAVISFSAPGARVLVVDDNDVNRRVTVGMLRKFGVVCETAVNGHEAVQMAEAKPYDIIFMDHMMPVMPGDEACRRIRASGGENAHTPILALTANAILQARDELLKAGMDDVITKPVLPERLGEALQKWLPERLVLRGDEEKKKDGYVDSFGIPGVHAEAAAERMGIGREFYIEALRLTMQTLPGAIAHQRNLLDEGDTKALKIEAHGLKGALSTIGAEEAAAKAQLLENVIDRGETEYLDKLFGEYELIINRLYKAIGKYMGEPTEEGKL